jgi:Holliday junction resolvase RusA-like endonuclease
VTWPAGQRLEFQVRALEPVPKGSMRGFVVKGRAVITDSRSAELRLWERRIREAASLELAHRSLTMLREQPCEVHLVLWLVRPRGDFRADGILRPRARSSPWVKPDIDKLQRTVFDALTSCVIDDDSRIVRVVGEKRYVESASQAGIAVRVIARAATVIEEWETSNER